MTKALLPNVLVLSVFWILTLLSLRFDRGLISGRTLREWILDLGGLVFQGVLIPLIQVYVLFKALSFVAPQAQGSWELAAPLAFLLNFVVVDYAYYLNHRLLHTKALWPVHAVHHSIESLDPVATSRNTLWTPVFIVYLWLNGMGAYLLKDPFWFLMGAATTAALDLWRHDSMFAVIPGSKIGKFFSRFMIFPIDHMWHHSESHADFNFGANLNIWDRLHGTFGRRRDYPSKLGIGTGMSFGNEVVNPYGFLPIQFAAKVWNSSKQVAGWTKQKRRTSYLGRSLAFFPLFIVSLTAVCLFLAFSHGNLLWFAGALFSLYLVPPLLFRLHNRFYPLETGMSKLSGGDYSPWWGGHQMQVLYLAVPSLESVLRLIPGCYSAWLRLWGSKVGKGIYWTPQVEITDRSLLEIGDHVIFGHKTAFYNHVANPRKDKILLFVQRTSVESGCFIGAGSRIGPGATIEAGVQLPILTDVHINQRVTTEMTFDPREKTNAIDPREKSNGIDLREKSNAIDPLEKKSLMENIGGIALAETGLQEARQDTLVRSALPPSAVQSDIETIEDLHQDEFHDVSESYEPTNQAEPNLEVAELYELAKSQNDISFSETNHRQEESLPTQDLAIRSQEDFMAIDPQEQIDEVLEISIGHLERDIELIEEPIEQRPNNSTRQVLTDVLDRESLAHVPPQPAPPQNSFVKSENQIATDSRFEIKSNEPQARPVFKIKKQTPQP